MLTAKLYRYRIPCQTGVVLRKQPLTERRGLILQLAENGNVGWGEIAPLPSFSHETLADAEAQVRQWIQHPTRQLDEFAPSVAFGISCALAELRGELGEAYSIQSAILCDGDINAFAQKIAQIENPLGKIKTGFNAAQEGELANQLLNEFPQLRLRLDANRAWSFMQAVEFTEKMANSYRVRIQFIEEPCHTPTLSRQFAEQTGMAIAWDETVREPDFVLENEPNVNAIVIKPTLTGSLQKCISLIERAHATGLSVVISSSLESSLGLTQLARFAHQYSPDTVSGLDTLNLMKIQLLRPWQGSTLPLVGMESECISPLQLDYQTNDDAICLKI